VIKIAFPKGRNLARAVGAADNLLRESFGADLWIKYVAKYVYEWNGGAGKEPLFRGVFMRARHIPELVAKRNYELGICGRDWVAESGWGVLRDHYEARHRGFGYHEIEVWSQEKENSLIVTQPLDRLVDIVLFCAENDPVAAGLDDAGLPGHYSRIAQVLRNQILSEYPRITQKYGLDCLTYNWPLDLELPQYPKVVACSGSAESHIPHDYRFGVCVRETGKTLELSHQRVLHVIFKTGAVLIANYEWEENESSGIFYRIYEAMRRTKAFAGRSK